MENEMIQLSKEEIIKQFTIEELVRELRGRGQKYELREITFTYLLTEMGYSKGTAEQVLEKILMGEYYRNKEASN